jgi:methylenetetrahydrofolate dehydrogenase (NADP+)/methenyltetrahydrofolate cyclohydrolase
MEAVDPGKDVDGFHPINMGRLLLGETNGFIPCTPEGIHRLLQAYKISLSGKHVVILGRSNIVGKPLAALLVQKNPTANATINDRPHRNQAFKRV